MRASVDTWRMIRSHWRIIAMASFVLLALFCVVVFILPNLMAPASDFSTAEDRLATQNDIRGTLVQAVVGIAILGGAAATAFFSARTISLNREGQITDRFTQATVQLATNNWPSG